MPNSTNEAYKRITGRDMPKPWTERSDEEKKLAREQFIASVEDSTPEDDVAVDEFIAIIQRNLQEPGLRVRLPQDVDAA